MAKNTNPFAVAHAQKEALTKQTEKRIQYVYKKSAEDIEKRLKTLEIINPSDHTKKIYFEGLLSDINGAQKDFNAQIFDIIVDAGEKSGFIAIDAGNKLMQGYGLTIQGAYSYIPRKEVENIVSGKLYGDKWSLSQSIWKSGLRTKSDIEKVVAQGLAENKSVKDIADALTQYVDPTARKPWDWSKVYPNTAQKVDYNAQRLARTMIQHSYQTSMVQSQLSNPFCKGIIWHSVGLHGRTCEMCEEMDGQTFPVDQLPLDHPNGMCYFEPSLEDMDAVADRLADWVNGGADPELDEYVSKAFGIDPTSPAAKTVVDGVKGDMTSASPSMNKQEYVDKNFENLQKKIIRSQKTAEEGKAIWEALRERLITLDEDQLRYMSASQKKLNAIVPSSNGYYESGKGIIHVDLLKDMKNVDGRGAFGTFFHEYGHFADEKAIATGHRYFFTASGEFKKELYFSLEKEYNKLLNSDGTLINSVRSALRHDDKTNAVQDLISGLSLNKNTVYWGHSKDYWLKDPTRQVVSEAMAHFNDTWSNPEKQVIMKQYFPESYDLFKKQVDKYLTAVKMK